MRGLDTLELDDSITKPKLAKNELNITKHLIKNMSTNWQPKKYQNNFQNHIMALMKKKTKTNKIKNVEQIKNKETQHNTNIINLTILTYLKLREQVEQHRALHATSWDVNRLATGAMAVFSELQDLPQAIEAELTALALQNRDSAVMEVESRYE